MNEPIRLHLACGKIKINGWKNIDARKDTNPDIVSGVEKLDFVEKNSVDDIYACHILEHFGFRLVKPTAMDVLKNWVSVLKPNGNIYLSVLDLKVIGRAFNNIRNTKQQTDFIYATFGGCNYEGNMHKTGFTEELLRQMMTNAGLKNIKPFESFVNDTSRFVLHGYPLSLNLVGQRQ
jgi:predicted SAM-dependent methyltransferase